MHYFQTAAKQMSVKLKANTIFSNLLVYSQLCFSIFLGAIIITSILQWMLFPSEIMAGSAQLVNGSLINRGAVIHRDFWSKETPLVFYLHSWAFRLLGESVIASKAIGIVIFICTLIGFYYYYRGHRRHSLITVIFLTFLSGYFLLFNLMQTKWIAYAFSFLAFTIYLISCQIKSNESKTDLLLVLSGIMTGLAILAKLNCGGYLFLGICCGLSSDFIFSDRRQYHLQRLVYFALPVITCIGLYLLAHLGHLPELIDQVIVFPGSKLGQHRIISLVNSDDSWQELLEDFWAIYLTVTFPLIWFHLQLVKSKEAIRRQTFIPLYIAIAITPLLFIGEFQSPNILPMLFIFPLLGIIGCQLFVKAIAPSQFATLCTYTFFLHYFLSRTDDNHYSPLFFFILILIVDALFDWRNYQLPKIYFYSLLILLTYYQFAIPWDAIGEKLLDGDRIINSTQVFKLKDTLLAKGDARYLMSANLPLSKPEAKLYDNQDELAALQLIYQNTNQDDYVYVGVTDHARVYVSNIKPYRELGRKIGVVNYILEPGLTTEKKVQSRTIAQLKENNVGWIVLWEQPKPERDFRARNYRGSDLLDRYIQQNYSLVKQFGDYFVYQQSV